ncbi:uncharacterized protein yc1106_08647 [Curvularia clavata]|uniref:Uncharacterized protein n=1 Tax=Curvularia clavata TaxID=95742 RepID=A0A9Q8ZIK2_CURCL|nr:uncharacterized protein yc1106_08647 [Curvularia clavata]
MAPSPRKCSAPTATTTLFNTTWHDADAASFDPSTLPLAKIPRAWERKQEVKKIGQGKEKKIWRRFGLRSRADDTADDEVDEEEQDARSRPFKRRQQMSPKAMEKTTTRPDSKKRAFKATRWDRRKSVLPRKRTALCAEAVPGAENETNMDDEGEDNSCDLTEGDSASFNEPDESMQGQDEAVTDVSITGGDQVSTFTFTLNETTTDDLPDHEDFHGDEEMKQYIDTASAEDTTLATLFRSPTKVDYPQLPHIHHEKGEPETVMEDIMEQPEKTALEESDSENGNEAHETMTEIQYPTLPVDTIKSASLSPSREEAQNMAGDSHEGTLSTEPAPEQKEDDDTGEEDLSSPCETRQSEEEFTEASLQLDIIKDYQKALREHSSTSSQIDHMSPKVGQQYQSAEDESGDDSADEVTSDSDSAETQNVYRSGDAGAPNSNETVQAQLPQDQITDGLVLSLSPSKSASSAPQKTDSPPSRLASGAGEISAFDDDTAMLKDFLNRAAASKAEKAAIATHRRESLQNRRDSDVVRHALASPRKALEEKDPNSPTKNNTELTLDLSQTLPLATPSDALPSPTPRTTEPEDTEEASTKGTRRSSRAKKSRLPAPASTGPAPTPKIAIRRNDGNEVVVLRKDDAKVLADLTRSNTRKNKQGAFGVIVRLMKAQMEAASLPPIDDTPKEIVVGKNVRWDEQLAYYQENPETVANALADAESLATPDELSFSDTGSEPKKKKEKISKTSTPKVRRVRGLGTANGTPAKGLTTPSSLLPEEVQKERETVQAKSASQKQHQVPKPKAAKAKKMPVASTSIDSGLSSSLSEIKLPSLEVAPVGVGATASTQRKSRLAAPKKVVLPQSTGSVEGKENSTLRGLTDATPKKGIPAPKVVVAHSAIATPSMESGLPRRRGKKF